MEIAQEVTKLKITECPDEPDAKNEANNENEDVNAFRDATDYLSPDNNLSDDDYGSCRSRSSSCSDDLQDCPCDEPTVNVGDSDKDSALEEEEGAQGDAQQEEEEEVEFREAEVEFDDEHLKDLEEKMSEEEKENRKEEALGLKEEGNKLFGRKEYTSAIDTYSLALRTCPFSYKTDRAMMFSNRAAAKVYMEHDSSAIRDCSKAIELYPEYVKALMRRAQLYEKTEKLDEALEDYKSVVSLDPNYGNAVIACKRLPLQIEERNERLKTEMMGKLKDLGNTILKPFGLSTENFQMQQDPNTGSYSIQFKNNSS